jgi:transposase
MRGEVLGFERRRRWIDDEKFGIIMSVGVDGAKVTQVAQRHDITRSPLYAWRHDLRKKGLWPPDDGALFIPLNVVPDPCVPVISDLGPSLSGPTPVELRLRSGRCLRFDSTMDPGALTPLIRVVKAA